jgi:uncharacterized protein
MPPAAEGASERRHFGGPGSAPAAVAEADGASLDRKEAELERLLASYRSVIIAYSGGVDSAYLGWIATRALGSRALCVTADSPSYPDRHRRLALSTARQFGFRHEVVCTGELARDDYRANPVNRCYFCKHELYTVLSRMARERLIDVIADGSNADDRGDYRPGRKAAGEFNVRSPLDEVSLTKVEIRQLARRASLPIWDEPASACLSSRIPYHSEVTVDKLRMIERAEDVLRELGFRVCRVRHHDALARLEIGRDELPRVLDPGVRERIVHELRAIGYEHVTLDLQGYRVGSLNEGLRLRPI